jgi:uncharacterized protein
MKIVDIILSPEEAFREDMFPEVLYRRLSLPEDGSFIVRPLKRSIDARSKPVRIRIQCQIIMAGEHAPPSYHATEYPDRSMAKRVIIVGSGPAGLFAAIRLLELGYKPVIVERGKDVKERRRDLAALNRNHAVNTDSNYCFGEGGAGTFSDGKLYTRSGKRGDISTILEILIGHGAKDEIRFDAHPHIGTNKLPKIITSIRASILHAGGEIHFNQRVNDLIMKAGRAVGVVSVSGDRFDGEAVILATGHSARDIFKLLYDKKIRIEPKAFAIGVRVEHPQEIIDRTQYHCGIQRDPFLPASSYSLVHQAVENGTHRGVFSFCMCPGGFIVPAATAPGEIVINGMSPSRRDSRFANSGIVVAVEPGDYKSYEHLGPLAGVNFQSDIEQLACKLSGGDQSAPAQRLVDFVNGRVSATLPECSYQPGLASLDMAAVLPGFISKALKEGFAAFGSKMKGFLTNEAQIVGVESRTSSPVRIPRDKDTLMHPQIKGLFPSGEGAGYAGGIVSAAMDGQRCAEALARMFNTRKV